MNLLESMMERCTLLNEITSGDGVLGRHTSWQDGATFDAVIIKDSSIEAQVAEKNGLKEFFTVVLQKGFGLDYHKVFRRNSDGAIFRVTSMQKDSEAPDASTVKIGKVTAERWDLVT
jgi:hypothetical protein